ncbi:hypothetical protein ACFR9S_06925 [Halolamina salina]|uniref:Transposase n=1 Tax=Halolamina salina TaxID=1220023 RepID=A0ABD6B5Z0_9EURY
MQAFVVQPQAVPIDIQHWQQARRNDSCKLAVLAFRLGFVAVVDRRPNPLADRFLPILEFLVGPKLVIGQDVRPGDGWASVVGLAH